MGRTFALADLHGQRALWNQIKNYLQSDDKLFFLGDAIDRGPNGYIIMKELLTDSRVTYLLGNHEFMMMEALQDIRNHGGEQLGEKLGIWKYNGAYPTLKAWTEDGAMYDWIQVINKEMPEYIEYTNTSGQKIGLSHAGFTPGAKPACKYDMIWDRKHLITEIPKEYRDGHIIIVHGHTPTPYLIKQFDEYNRSMNWINQNKRVWDYRVKNGIVFYGEGFIKIDIDCGSFATGHARLVNLDTWEIVSFDAKVEE